MRRNIAAAALAAMIAAPAAADEIETTLEAALEAYRTGDIALAKEEIDYAATLMAQRKAESLSGFLPEPMAGWERSDPEGNQGVATFSGGMMASAVYSRDGDRIEIQLMAENQMVASMAMMLSNPAMMGTMGTVRRVGRQKLVVTSDDDVQALVGNAVFVQVSGPGSVEDKLAYFEAIDLRALERF